MPKLLTTIVFTFVLLASPSAIADLKDLYSTIYTKESLKSGTKIRKRFWPESVHDEFVMHSKLVDKHWGKKVLWDGAVYKVISFGSEKTLNPHTYVLSIVEVNGNFVGRCTADFGKICELEV